MKGSIGTQMNVIYRRPKRGNVTCKDCKYLQYGGNKKSPYFCSLKNKQRHYTSVVYCKKKELKEVENNEQIERIKKAKRIYQRKTV